MQMCIGKGLIQNHSNCIFVYFNIDLRELEIGKLWQSGID